MRTLPILRLLAILTLLAALFSTLRAQSSMINDRLDISNHVTAMLHAIDALDWSTVRASFDDRVTLDYTSLFGGEPATMSGDDLIKTWQGLLPGFDATQHMIGPVISNITGDYARAETHVRGYHRLDGAAGGDMWMVAGHYLFQFRRAGGQWRISAMTLIAYYQEGNLRLPGAAQARVGSGYVRPARTAK